MRAAKTPPRRRLLLRLFLTTAASPESQDSHQGTDGSKQGEDAPFATLSFFSLLGHYLTPYPG